MMKKFNFRLIDILNVIYILFNLILIIFGWQRVVEPLSHFIVFFLILLFVVGLAALSKRNKTKITDFLRDWYSLFLFLYFFEATAAVNRVIFPDFLDPFFQKIDFLIWGYQPTMIWGKIHSNFFLQELFHFAYFCYYLIPLLFIYIYLKKRELFSRFVFITTFVFYLCYTTFIILPVIGGRWWEMMENYRSLTTEYRYGVFTRIMAAIYRETKHQGGAFPSSHVAIAVVSNLVSFRINKILGWILVPIVVLLTIATVYCHYHYFIDTIFGIIYGVLFFVVGSKIYDSYGLE